MSSRLPMRIAMVFCLIFMVSGCFRHTYVTDKPVAVYPAKETQFKAFFLNGIIPFEPQTPLQDTCPNGVARIETEESFLNGLVNYVTRGIYTPRTARIYCQEK
jgi:hypothetical protein